MATLSWVMALLGGLCFIAAIVAALGYCNLLCVGDFTPTLWLGISGVLFLACIAAGIGSIPRD